MPSQIDGIGRESVLSEVVEKIDVPTPGAMQHSVDKEERRWLPTLERMLGKHLQFHRIILQPSAGAWRRIASVLIRGLPSLVACVGTGCCSHPTPGERYCHRTSL